MTFHFSSALFQEQLQALPPLSAFERSADLLLSLRAQSPQQILSGLVESRQLKEELFAQIATLEGVPGGELVRTLSLQTLAAGLLCGGLDGAILYHAQIPPDVATWPEDFEGVGAALWDYLEVADRQWRELDANGLQLHAAYGKHLNRATDQENVDFLGVPGRQARDTRRVMAETFRTAYSLGLIDAAVVFVAGERPDTLGEAGPIGRG